MRAIYYIKPYRKNTGRNLGDSAVGYRRILTYPWKHSLEAIFLNVMCLGPFLYRNIILHLFYFELGTNDDEHLSGRHMQRIVLMRSEEQRRDFLPNVQRLH